MTQGVLLYHKNKAYKISDEKSKFYYNILVDKKFERPYKELIWSKQMGIDADSFSWSRVYTNKVKLCTERKMVQFNYKLIGNVLPCGYVMNKRNKEVSPICNISKQSHTVKHMLFDCVHSKVIWNVIEDKFKAKNTEKINNRICR